MLKLHHVAIIALIATAGTYDCAFAGPTQQDVTPYPDVASIPELLKRAFKATPDEYVASLITRLRSFSNGKDELTNADIEAIRKAYRRQEQKGQLSRLSEYDFNFDTQVTREEVRRDFLEVQTIATHISHEVRSEKTVADKIDAVMAYDYNFDGILTYHEMSTPMYHPYYGRNIFTDRVENDEYVEPANAEKLLDLDPNHDGRLTARELELLARRAYRTVDTDNSGAVSDDEFRSYYETRRRTYRYEAPKPPASRSIKSLIDDGYIVMTKDDWLLIESATGGPLRIVSKNSEAAHNISKDPSKATVKPLLQTEAYKLVKEIPYLPEEITRNKTAPVIIGTGIPVPRGYWTTCAFFEETGEVIFGP